MKYLITLIILVVSSGCALTQDTINIQYEGKANLIVVEGAESIEVLVKHEDKRTVYKDRVGTKKNGYGMEMAKIVPANDIAKTFADAIKFELQNLGFKIGDNRKKLTVELVRFYNDFKMGFFAGDAVADGLINVAIKDKSGELLFSKSYEGGAIEPNIQLALGHNAEIALKKTMANIVEKIAHDKDMHSALLK